MNRKKWPVMNLAAGPVEVSPRVLRALSRPVLYHYDPAFIEVFDDTCTLVQKVFQTKYDVVLMQGEAILGLEAAAASLFGPGVKVLNLVSGIFGKGYEHFIKKYSGEYIELAVPYNESISAEAVRAELSADPDIKYLSVVHSETPSGTVNPMKEIGAVAREHGVITIVDTVSGLGSEVFSPEDWGMDVAISGPQKCLGGPPGLSLITVSPDAWHAMERRAPPLRGSFLSILDWKDSWLAGKTFPYTPSVSTVYGLEAALLTVLEEGIESYVGRHQAVARACRRGVEALGLELWAAREEICGAAVTAVAMPDKTSEKDLRRHMRERYGVMSSGGYGEVAGKLFRLGHMGQAAHPAYLAAQLGILERSLVDLGVAVEFGAGVGAAMRSLEG